MRKQLVWCVVAVLVVGCGRGDVDLPVGRDDVIRPATSSVDPASLAAWATFPADAKPRPIILGEIPQFPQDAFATGEAKLAAISGSYELVAALPADPPPTLNVTLLDGTADLPTRTARQAVDVLTAAPAKQDVPPLRITGVELGTATFGSDRGPLPLPAWLFTAPDVNGPIAVPAIAASAIWPTEQLLFFESARLGPDGRTLSVVMPGPNSVCPGSPVYRLEPDFLESASAVVVGLRSIPDGIAPGTPVSNCAMTAAMRMATYTVTLAAPLGGRVLVHGSEILAVQPG